MSSISSYARAPTQLRVIHCSAQRFTRSGSLLERLSPRPRGASTRSRGPEGVFVPTGDHVGHDQLLKQRALKACSWRTGVIVEQARSVGSQACTTAVRKSGYQATDPRRTAERLAATSPTRRSRSTVPCTNLPPSTVQHNRSGARQTREFHRSAPYPGSTRRSGLSGRLFSVEGRNTPCRWRSRLV
jgi:hypothetical protein